QQRVRSAARSAPGTWAARGSASPPPRLRETSLRGSPSSRTPSEDGLAPDSGCLFRCPEIREPSELDPALRSESHRDGKCARLQLLWKVVVRVSPGAVDHRSQRAPGEPSSTDRGD